VTILSRGSTLTDHNATTKTTAADTPTAGDVSTPASSESAVSSAGDQNDNDGDTGVTKAPVLPVVAADYAVGANVEYFSKNKAKYILGYIHKANHGNKYDIMNENRQIVPDIPKQSIRILKHGHYYADTKVERYCVSTDSWVPATVLQTPTSVLAATSGKDSGSMKESDRYMVKISGTGARHVVNNLDYIRPVIVPKVVEEAKKGKGKK
jgi:hypothetical protein